MAMVGRWPWWVKGKEVEQTKRAKGMGGGGGEHTVPCSVDQGYPSLCGHNIHTYTWAISHGGGPGRKGGGGGGCCQVTGGHDISHTHCENTKHIW